jgi:hypothetical protein
MLLREMFSPIGAPKDEKDEIDWLGDLKFFIDNDSDVLSKQFFPAIRKHQEYKGHPDAYKLYIKPLEGVCETYCNKYDVDERSTKFPKEKLIELAKHFAEEQERHIERGDYHKK